MARKSVKDVDSKTPTQNLIQISEIRDGIAIFTDRSIRASLLVSSMNFALKAEEEQNSIIYAFQDFLNSLDFPIQIAVISRKLDITPYLEQLRQRQEKQINELLRLQMNEYINFIDELVKGSEIMTKSFFVTVPFAPQQSKTEGIGDKISNLLKGLRKTDVAPLADSEFDHYKKQLLQRVEQVAVGLRGIGLRLVPLQSQEMLEMLYNSMNPVTSRHQKLANVAQLAMEETEPRELTKVTKERIPWVERSRKTGG